MPVQATLTRPTVVLAQSEASRLSHLAQQMETVAPLAANLLLDEIERAEIRPDEDVPADVVRMGSTVEFLDEAHGARRTVQLVYPADADIAADRVSILTPVGAGLIGLSAGHEILWPDREGRERALRILSVRAPAKE
jgi:regulator of nucleoside diphosphate kinase